MMTKELFDAIEKHDLKRTRELLCAGANPNEGRTSAPWRSPLNAAIEEIDEGGAIEALVLLLRHGALVDGTENSGNASPLLIAVYNHQLDAARILLASGADPIMTDDEGEWPLSRSVMDGNLEMTTLLLMCAEPSTINKSGGPTGMNLLGMAVYRLNLPIVKLLLDAGADAEVLDSDRRTAREHMPPRNVANQEAWDAVKATLER
jgi:uncharacterized protein